MISDRKDMATFEPTVLPAMQPTETIGIQICFILSYVFLLWCLLQSNSMFCRLFRGIWLQMQYSEHVL